MLSVAAPAGTAHCQGAIERLNLGTYTMQRLM